MSFNYCKGKVLKIFSLLLLGVLVSCAPVVKSSLSGAPGIGSPHTLAVLPAVAKATLPRERVQYIHENLIRDLTSSGYRVLDDVFVKKICSTPECLERNQIAAKYPVDAFVELKIDSISRNNFFAGYVNAISGSIRFVSSDGIELVSVTHTAQERGGLLFNSGQLLQAVSTTISNTEEDSTKQLAEKFVKEMVSKLPNAPLVANGKRKETPVNLTADSTFSGRPGLDPSEEMEINLAESWIEPLGGARFKICAKGSPGQAGFVLIGWSRSALIEQSPGTYCRVLLIDPQLQSPARFAVELRSPFGVVTQKPLAIDAIQFCSLNGLINMASVTNSDLRFTKFKKVGGGVEQNAADCNLAKVIVYDAPEQKGPYIRLGQTNFNSNTEAINLKRDKSKVSNSPQQNNKLKNNFALVAIKENGLQSAPLLLEGGSSIK